VSVIVSVVLPLPEPSNWQDGPVGVVVTALRFSQGNQLTSASEPAVTFTP
jgi:hypothetical protein